MLFSNAIMFNGLHLVICFGMLVVGLGVGILIGFAYAEERNEAKQKENTLK